MIPDSGLTVLLLLFAAMSCCTSTNTALDSPPELTYCPIFTPQIKLNWTQTIGKWNVVEVLMHSIDPKQVMRSSHSYRKTCPIVKLRTTDQGGSPSNIELLWNEWSGDLQYSFTIDESGQWVPNGLQNGTLLDQGYSQFSGVVQIMLADDTLMVLTFCSTAADNKKYSMIFSKKRYLTESESKKIRELLSLRGLTMALIQENCNNSGNRKELNNILRWITLLVAIAATASQIFTTSSKNLITSI